MSLRDELLAAKPAMEPAETPDHWPKGLFVRRMTGEERAEWNDFADEYNALTPEERVKARLPEHLVALSLCEENGDRLFTTSAEDIELIYRKLEAEGVERLCAQGMRVSKIGTVEAEKTLKNFESTRRDSSSAGSCSPSGAPAEPSSTPESTASNSPSGKPAGD